MDNNLFNGGSLPQLNTSFSYDMVNRISKQTQDMIDSIKPLDEILTEQIKPLLEGNQQVIEGLSNNYQKLGELYQLKEKELQESKEEAKKSKKYNSIMLIIALISGGIALASLVATIIISILGGAA